MQSRYYDPEIGRFINADTQFDGNGGFSGYNLFTYCANSPITLKDTSGFAIETALDIVSIAGSLCSFIANPTWASAGYVAWDIVAAIIPCVPGSYISKGTKFIVKVAGKLDDFADGSKLLTGSNKALKNMLKGIKGLEIHHLIEKRFRSLFKVGANDFLSLPLTKEMHQIITNRWRNLHTLDDIFQDFAY